MTRDEIMALARQAGGYSTNFNGSWMFYAGDIEKFAALVAEAEREACAKVCEEQGNGRKALEHYAALTYSGSAHDCAKAIRARGQA